MKTTLAFIIIFFSHLAYSNEAQIQSYYNQVRAKATQLAGQPEDIPQRIQILKKIYIDSHKNYTFPLVAAHGAKWAHNYFSKIKTSLNYINLSIPFYLRPNVYTVEYEILQFINDLETINRAVFIDTFTNYFFTKYYGTSPLAQRKINPQLLKSLVNLHSNKKISETEKRQAFVQSLMYEQLYTVSPGIKKAVSQFDNKILLSFILQPIFKFSYFPAWTYFKFDDFSNRDERIAYAIKSYDIAIQVGWDKVLNSL